MVTDASHTAALTSAMKRRDLVPRAIAVGCDLFLFYNDPDDDMGFMRDGYRNGVITEERLTDALHAILGTKAALGLHRKKPAEIVPPAEEALARIGLPENKAVFESATDRSITLAKYTDETILPITPDRYPGCSLSPSGAGQPCSSDVRWWRGAAVGRRRRAVASRGP